MKNFTYIEPEVVQLAQQGDETASRRIIEDLHRPIMAFAYRMLGSGYKQELEDLAQDIFLKLFRALHRFDPERGVKFTTWVFTFVRNHCLDLMKKRRLATTSLTYFDEEEGQWQVQDESVIQPIRHAQNGEIHDKLDDALEQISADQRQVFVMREKQGMDYGDIATKVGVAEGTVKSRLHRARLALRGLLSELEPEGSQAQLTPSCC